MNGECMTVEKKVALLTTGATVEACAMALTRVGAAKVSVLTLARVLRPEG